MHVCHVNCLTATGTQGAYAIAVPPSDALVAVDCEVEEIIERHSHAIVIGRVRDLIVSSRSAALAYWQGQYVSIGRDEDIVTLAEVGVPAARRSHRR